MRQNTNQIKEFFLFQRDIFQYCLFIFLYPLIFLLTAEPKNLNLSQDSFDYFFTSKIDSLATHNRIPIFVSGRLEKNGKIELTKEIIPKSSFLMIVPSFSVWNEPMNPTFENQFYHSITLLLKTNPTTKGLVLDAEFGAKQSKDSYTNFVCSIHKLIKTKDSNLQFHLALFPPNHPDQHGYYDLAKLYSCSDNWIFMFYDEHSPRTKPGPISTSNWIESNLSEIEKKLHKKKLPFEIPIASIRQKIYLGLPLYGYAKTKSGKFGKVVPIQNWIVTPEFQSSRSDYSIIKHNGEVIYLPTAHFLKHWEKISTEQGYAGIAYWREEFATMYLNQ